MLLNCVPYTIFVFKPLEYVAMTKLVKKDFNTLLTATLSHINVIRKQGLKIALCEIDGESTMSTEWFQSKISAERTI